jgi:hypothetical protein
MQQTIDPSQFLREGKTLVTCFICQKQGYKCRNGNVITFIHYNGVDDNTYRTCSTKVYPTLDEAFASVRPYYRKGVDMRCPKCKKMGKGRRLQDHPGTWRYVVYHPNSEKSYCHYSTFTEDQKKSFMKIMHAAKYIESDEQLQVANYIKNEKQLTWYLQKHKVIFVPGTSVAVYKDGTIKFNRKEYFDDIKRRLGYNPTKYADVLEKVLKYLNIPYNRSDDVVNITDRDQEKKFWSLVKISMGRYPKNN